MVNSEGNTEVDVVVIGLGPGGEAVATQLAGGGLEVVGRRPAAGRRRVPVLRVRAEQDDDPRAPTCSPRAAASRSCAGASTVEPDWTPVADRIRDEATDDWDDQIAVDRLVDAGVRFVRGTGRLAGERTVVVGDETFVRRKGVVLNTGTEPAVPPIDGLADTPYWTNRDAVQRQRAAGFADRDRRRCDRRWSWRRPSPGSASHVTSSRSRPASSRLRSRSRASSWARSSGARASRCWPT